MAKCEVVDRKMEAWEDAVIVSHDLHRLNEEMVLNGDVPYYDCCPAVGDGHSHLLVSALLPPRPYPGFPWRRVYTGVWYKPWTWLSAELVEEDTMQRGAPD